MVTVVDQYCSHCGNHLNPNLENFDSRDVFINTAHPTNVVFRRYIEREIATKFNQGSERKLKVRDYE